MVYNNRHMGKKRDNLFWYVYMTRNDAKQQSQAMIISAIRLDVIKYSELLLDQRLK